MSVPLYEITYLPDSNGVPPRPGSCVPFGAEYSVPEVVVIPNGPHTVGSLGVSETTRSAKNAKTIKRVFVAVIVKKRF